jgi:hypothetical protein
VSSEVSPIESSASVTATVTSPQSAGETTLAKSTSFVFGESIGAHEGGTLSHEVPHALSKRVIDLVHSPNGVSQTLTGHSSGELMAGQVVTSESRIHSEHPATGGVAQRVVDTPPARHASIERRLLHRKVLPEVSHASYQGTPQELSQRSVEHVPTRDVPPKREEPADAPQRTLPESSLSPFTRPLITRSRGDSVEAMSTPIVQSHSVESQMLHRKILPQACQSTPEEMAPAHSLTGNAVSIANTPPALPESPPVQIVNREGSAETSLHQETATQELHPLTGNAVAPIHIASVREEAREGQSLHRTASEELHYPTNESAVHGSRPAGDISAEQINPRHLIQASSEMPSLVRKTSTQVDSSQSSDLILPNQRTAVSVLVKGDDSHEGAVPVSSPKNSDALPALATPRILDQRSEPHLLHRTISSKMSLAGDTAKPTLIDLAHIANTSITGVHRLENENEERPASSGSHDLQAFTSRDRGSRTNTVTDATRSTVSLVDREVGQAPVARGRVYLSDRVTSPDYTVVRMAAQRALVASPPVRPKDNAPSARPQLLNYGSPGTADTSPVWRYFAAGVARTNGPAAANHGLQHLGSTGMIHRLSYALPSDINGVLQRAAGSAPIGPSSGAVPSGAVPPLYDSPQKAGMSNFQVQQLADQVYGMLVRRLSREKDRRGISDAI